MRVGFVGLGNIGRPMAVVLDGEVVTAPVIVGEIPHGRVQVTFGELRDHRELAARAARLVATLRTNTRSSTEWIVVDVREL